MKNKLLLKNCRIYNKPQNDLYHILITGTKITHIDADLNEITDAEIIDAGGKILSSGFIDVHIQGAGGADVLDATPEALPTISNTLARLGVTGFLTTTVLKPSIKNRHLELAAELTNTNLGGANLLGIHLEGPFINPEKRGGIAPEAVLPPNIKLLDEIFAITGDSLKMMTIAPELTGNSEIISKLLQHNIIVSFGHSSATYEQLKDGFKEGITHVTHLFNAMPGLHHRQPGPILAIFEEPGVSVQLIVDGVHIHPGIVRMVHQILGKDRIVTITDGVQAIGLPDGKYMYNEREYESKNGTARYPDGTLIGVSVGLNEMMLRFMKFTGCSLAEAIDTVTINPARTLGIVDRKASVTAGKDADLVILDFEHSIWATIINGKIVYLKNTES